MTRQNLSVLISMSLVCVALAQSDAVVIASSQPAMPAPRYVNANRVILSYAAETSEKIHRVEVWLSTDGRAIWKPAEAKRFGESALRYDAPRDGRYEFFIVLESDAGRSADPPASGAAPHVIVVVDTAPPTLQVHRLTTAPPAAYAGDRAALHIETTLRDEHLGPAGVRVFYRSAGAKDAVFLDGGVVTASDGAADWLPPRDAPTRLDLRVLATDLAGNRAVEEILDVAAPPRDSPATMATTAANTAGEPSSENPNGTPDAAAPTARPVVKGTTAEATTRPAEAKPASAADLARLRRLAEQYRAQGRHRLAAARLEEALASFPDDVALRIELGESYAATDRLDDAQREFETVLARAPDNVRARDALAGVAMEQRRYAEARTHLTKLLERSECTPELWMRLGDAEARLGNRAEAIAAWRKVFEIEPADEAARTRAKSRLETADFK